MKPDTERFPGMVSLDDLLPQFDDAYARVVGVENLPLRSAFGRVLARDLTAVSPIPPFANSSMDGWAVRVADLPADGGVLPIGGRIAAGRPLDGAARPGFAYRIFTGASVPSGLDAVAMQEVCRREGDTVHLPPLNPGDNVRAAGETLTAGEVALKAGCRLRAQEIGLAAMLGLTELPVCKRLRVAVFSTGDELREAGRPLPEGCIYDANRHVLFGLLTGLGCDVADFGIVSDRPEAVREALTRAAADRDLVVTTGGASVGEEDHIKAVLAELGEIRQWRVAMKPGKPVVLGRVGEAAFVGLPGNPVSTMVSFLMIARPIVARLCGLTLPRPRRYAVPAGFRLHKTEPRREFRRAALRERDGRLELELFRSESSGVLVSMTAADGLIDLAEGSLDVAPGDPVPFIPFSELQP